MSIFSTIFQIEDEREWIANLEADGIAAGVIRDGGPGPDDLDAPYVYQGSHVLPGQGDARGGALELALIPAHVRFWRDHPHDSTLAEPEGCEPFLRVSLDESREAPERQLGSATVLLTLAQVARLQAALAEWLAEAGATAARASTLAG